MLLSKKESQARADRRERRRSQNRRQTLVWNLIVLGTLGAFLLLVAWFVVANLRPGPLPGEDEGVGHLAEGATLPVFQHDPPASGTHYAQAAPWGLAAAPVPPGTYLHNLGIGGVVFLYKCSTPCPDLEAKFLVLYKKAPPDSLTGQRKILITPYEKDLPPSAVIVALAWDHQLNLAQFNEALMLRWYKRFVNQGPEPAQ
jgi:hypothetical protein